MRTQGIISRAFVTALMLFPVGPALSLSVAATVQSEFNVTPDLATSPATPEGTNAAAGQAIRPAQVNLPPQLGEIVRLAQAGVGDEVIIAYIRRSDATVPITADQILYMRDLGISPDVLEALVDLRPLQGGTSGESTDQMEPQQGTDTNATYAPPPADIGSSTVPVLPPAVAYNPADAGYFYGALAPYGSWLNVAGYGWCWQPTAGTIDQSWRPYGNDGNWIWSDSGWFWNSNYSWGWAPFHYGRWFQVPHHGWLWHPDREWGPAWVCWRESDEFCGWAPLPPGARFSGGSGWTFKGKHVDPLFDFSLPASAFTFIPKQHFTDERVFLHRVPGQNTQAIFANTKVHHDLVIGPNHRVFNRGIEPARIEAASHRPIRQVSLREFQARRAPFQAVTSRLNVPRSSAPFAPVVQPRFRHGFDMRDRFPRMAGQGNIQALPGNPGFRTFIPANQLSPPPFVSATPSTPPTLPAPPILPAPLGSRAAPIVPAHRAGVGMGMRSLSMSGGGGGARR